MASLSEPLICEDLIRTRLNEYGIKHYNVPEACSNCVRAAVLIGLQLRGGSPHVLLTVRSNNLRSHPSTVAFPGGKVEDDEQLIDTVIRESHEEIGLERDDLEILCSFPGILTIPNVLTSAFIGLISTRFIPRLNPQEVSYLFWLPLRRFLSADNHSTKLVRGDEHSAYILHYFIDTVDNQAYKTWGFTAHLCIIAAVAVFREATEWRIIDTIPIDKDDVIGCIQQLVHHYCRLQVTKLELSRL